MNPANSRDVYRILDANANRAREALRVAEDTVHGLPVGFGHGAPL